MEPEWNNPPYLDDASLLGLRGPVDIDDYINKLIQNISQLESINQSLKQEICLQRKEIAALREERKFIVNNDNPPGRCIDW